MKKTRQLILILTLLIGLPLVTFGQAGPHDLLIPGATSAYDFLNNHVMGDTTAAGDRADLERVYVLQRGGIYFVNTTMRNNGWAFRMKAEDGTGQLPVVYLLRNATTNSVPQFCDQRGDLWLKDLILVGYLEAAGLVADIPAGLIQTGAAGFNITIDGCIMSNTRGQHIRCNSATKTVKVANSILANMGHCGTSNLGAGKFIDIRDTSCDSMIIVNNTFVNFQDRIIRHRSSTANINHLVFDHNSIVNGMSYHGTLALGWVGDDVKITNNLFIDPFSLGNDTDAVRQSEFDESGEKDAFGGGRMTWVISVPNDSTAWTVNNNYYSVSPEGQAFYDTYASAGVTGEGSPLTWHINSKLGADSASAFVKELITMVNIPELMITFNEWYRSPAGANKTKATTNWNATFDFDRRPWEYFDDELNCTFPTTTAAYMGAEGGFPAGDLNWWPDLKAIWDAGGTIIGVNDPDSQLPTEFTLNQNYPNPFNPTTRIEYSLPVQSQVKLEVFNVLGKHIATLINRTQEAGSHSISFDASDLSSGIYFYKLTSQDNVITKKMMLLK
ncbi:MAG: T9SS type A sorting domain-containing protein [bacterium]